MTNKPTAIERLQRPLSHPPENQLLRDGIIELSDRLDALDERLAFIDDFMASRNARNLRSDEAWERMEAGSAGIADLLTKFSGAQPLPPEEPKQRFTIHDHFFDTTSRYESIGVFADMKLKEENAALQSKIDRSVEYLKQTERQIRGLNPAEPCFQAQSALQKAIAILTNDNQPKDAPEPGTKE